MQAEVSPFYADLVKFAQLGYGIDGCLITGYRVNFEIQVGGREDWVELKDLLILPYSVSSGFSYRRFLKYRSDQTAPGLWDPTVPEVSVPPEGHHLVREEEHSPSQVAPQPLEILFHFVLYDDYLNWNFCCSMIFLNYLIRSCFHHLLLLQYQTCKSWCRMCCASKGLLTN